MFPLIVLFVSSISAMEKSPKREEGEFSSLQITVPQVRSHISPTSPEGAGLPWTFHNSPSDAASEGEWRAFAGALYESRRRMRNLD